MTDRFLCCPFFILTSSYKMKRNAKGYKIIVPRCCVGYDLSFRAVASQVLSALQSLTSVFGMGTGGPFALKTLTLVHLQGFEPGTH